MKKVFVPPALLFSALLFVTLSHSEEAAETAPPQSVEQRLSILERKYELDQEAAAAKAKDGASVTAGKDGFFIKTNDGNSQIRFSAVLQTDYRDYHNDHGGTQFNDQFLVRRVRPTLEGVINKVIGFRFTPDFANGGGTTAGPTSTLLIDAYLDLLYWNAAKLRFGKFKHPFGLENIQSDQNGFFVERSLVNQLGPNRDVGVQLSGDFLNGAISYQTSIQNGTVDGASGENDSSDGKEYDGRLFFIPFKSASSEWINGFGTGVAGTIGDQFGSAATSNLTSGYRTDGQQTFFTYQSGTFANGQRKRISPQVYWYTTRTGLLGEYTASSQEVRRVATSTQTATLTHRAWQIAGSFVVTGERPSFNSVKPRKAFGPKNGGWGALELVARYSVFRAEDESFNRGFSSITASARKAKAWAAGFNWFLNNNVRISSDYAVTSFTGGAAAGNRPTEKVILNRVQLVY